MDTKRWQVYSAPLLARTDPEKLFPDFAPRYRELHADIWQRITRVHGTLRTLETLEDFPFEYIYSPYDMEFWRLVFENFFEIAIILLYGLLDDSGNRRRDPLTLHSLRSDCARATWTSEDMKKLFFKTFAAQDRKNGELLARVKVIRHAFVAHRDKQNVGQIEIERVTLNELFSLLDGAQSLFGALSFGSAYSTLAGDFIPSTIGGKPQPSCLEEVLNLIALNSHFVRQSDTDLYWGDVRQHVDESELGLMNEWRKRLGLPDA